MSEVKPYISFIIPAFNESEYIGTTIKSIHQGKLSVEYEIIVIDHNSTDDTVVVAESQSAKVVKKIGGTIASVRNYGVKKCSGHILVFLDSDVTLMQEWFQNIEKAMKELKKHPKIITGSHCSVPQDANWIERYWFDSYVEEKNSTNLGSGHMIVSREFFEEIGGFDESLSTGEDYELCMRAIRNGGKIISNPKLKVIHHDFPKGLLAFIKREAWHGKGDVGSLRGIVSSKVAVAALLFGGMHVLAITFPLLFGFSTFAISIPIAGIIGIVILSSFMKFRHCGLNVVLVNSVIFYFYFWGRLISFFGR